MDYKVTKQDVTIHSLVFDDSAEQAIDTEFTLPDYCPDIARILKCRITPKIGARSISGGTLSVEGAAQVNLLYVDAEKNTVRACATVLPFSKGFEVGAGLEMSSPKVRATVNYFNCRAVTQRKVEVHGTLSLRAKVYQRRRVSVVCDVDGGGTQLLRGSVSATNTLGEAEKFIILSEDVDIGQSKPAVRSILRSDARAAATECKIIAGKVIIKGEVRVDTLYAPEGDGGLERMESVLPVSQIVDLEGVTEDCSCALSLEVASLEVKPRTNLSGETRGLNIAGKLTAELRGLCDGEIPVVLDAYSTRFDAECQRNEVPFEKLLGAVSESFLCRKTLEVPRETLSSVLDLWCETTVTSARGEGSQLALTGNVLICLLGEDSEKAPAYVEHTVEFEYRYNLPHEPQMMRCDPDVTVISASYTLLPGDQIEVRVELGVTADIFEMHNLPVLTEVELLADRPKPPADASLILYYADAGERVWDIARKYNTSIETLVSLNGLTDSEMPGKAMLLIPSE